MYEPAAREEVVHVAMPWELSVPTPTTVEPLLKVTRPVGEPLPEVGATLDVKVTLCPAFNCVDDAAREVAVGPDVVGAGVNTNTVTE